MSRYIDFSGLLECGEGRALVELRSSSDFWITKFSIWLVGKSSSLVTIVAPKFSFVLWVKLRNIMG